MDNNNNNKSKETQLFDILSSLYLLLALHKPYPHCFKPLINPCCFSGCHLHLVASSIPHCTKMYPMALMCLFPLSGLYFASFPHVLWTSCFPPVPNPILESQVSQLFSLLLMMPILALDQALSLAATLKPSVLQLVCKEA